LRTISPIISCPEERVVLCLVRSWGYPSQAPGNEIQDSSIRLARNLDGECIEGMDTTLSSI
jgi:hypothetical protein